MPSAALNFAFSNTAPSAISVAAFAGTGSAPVAVAGAAFTPSNTAPTAITPPSVAGTASSPEAVALAAFAPSNTAPSAVSLPAYAGTGSPPTAVAVAAFTPSNLAPSPITPPSVAGTASAPEAVALAPFAGTGVAPSALAAPLAAAATQNVPQLVGFDPAIPTPTDDTMHTPSFLFAGRLTAGQLFGFYKAPAAVALKGVQLACQDAPTGADVIIEVVDNDGVSLGRTATLPAGASTADVTFVTPLPLVIHTLVRLKVTQVGSTKAGSFLTANLIVQLV